MSYNPPPPPPLEEPGHNLSLKDRLHKARSHPSIMDSRCPVENQPLTMYVWLETWFMYIYASGSVEIRMLFWSTHK